MMMPHDDHPADAHETAHSRKRRLGEVTHFTNQQNASHAPPVVIPWSLQHYFDGEIDLIRELSSRFPQVPVMSLINLRRVGRALPRSVATLSTQDGAASLVIEVDQQSQATQFSFILSSMLALRFTLGALTPADHAGWVEAMRGETGEPAFLWGEQRWGTDYLIGAVQKNFSILFAFSPGHAEAAARLTPEVSRKLLDWLHQTWDASL